MSSPPPSAPGGWRVGAAWFAGALALYGLSAARGLVWADSSKLTLYALDAYFPSLNPGDHAGWTVLAWSWLHLLGGDPVAAAHRLSAVAGALAVALTAVLVLRRSGDRTRAHTAAALMLAALPVWWAASVAETYAPALAATLAGAVVLRAAPRPWRWVAAGGAWGLALAIHAMAAFLVVPLAWEGAGRRGWRLAPGLAAGLAPVWLALFGGARDPLTGFAASGVSTWRWHWEAFLALARVPRNAAVLIALLVYAFGALGVLALWRGRREPRGSRVWAGSLAALTLLLLAYAPYRLHLMAGFLLAGVLLAVPVRLSGWGRAGHVALQLLLYLAVPAALTLAGRQDLGVRVLPGRNNAFYFLCPIKSVRGEAHEGRRSPATDVRAWLRRALDPGTTAYLAGVAECAPRDAGTVVLADFNPGAVLRLAQAARGWRGDLDVRPVAVDVALGAARPLAALASEVEEALGAGPVVLADRYEPYYHVRELSSRFALQSCGDVVVVRPARTAPRDGRWPS